SFATGAATANGVTHWAAMRPRSRVFMCGEPWNKCDLSRARGVCKVSEQIRTTGSRAERRCRAGGEVRRQAVAENARRPGGAEEMRRLCRGSKEGSPAVKPMSENKIREANKSEEFFPR